MSLPIIDEDSNPRLVAVRLAQEGDCCDRELLQYLEVEVVDGGGGAYAVLKTERWACSPAALVRLAGYLEGLVGQHDGAEAARDREVGA